MGAYRFLSVTGYVLSFIIALLWFSISGLLFAFFLYPFSILLRGAGWISVAKSFQKKYFYLPAFFVIFGGLLFLGALTNSLGFLQLSQTSSGLDVLKIFALIWLIYSTIELTGYILLTRTSKIFLASASSAIGILLMIIFVTSPVTELNEFFAYAFYAIPFLLLSALASAIGFNRLYRAEQAIIPGQYSVGSTFSNLIVCTKCGKAISADSKFCPYCGQPMTS